ncbi:ABC transporter permease [Paenibacillus humicus]|uniref:ABC transporter permease n=1 Tax=Paenibacillus humicus TaxID=412861 RepID=UPI003D273A23
MRLIEVYFRIQYANFKARLAYPTNFFVGIFGISLIGLLNIALLWILTNSVPLIKGWNFYELLFLVSIWRIADGIFILLFEQIRQLDNLIREGVFDRYLVRPFNSLFLFSTHKFEVAGLGDIISGGIALLIAVNHIGEWNAGKILLLIMVILTGAIIEWSIYTIISCSAFWTIQAEGLRSLINPFLYNFTQYPLSIYSNPIKIIMTFIIPIGFMSFYPSHLFFEKSSVPFNENLIYLSPIIAIVLALLSISLWSKGINAYKGAGS